ncbi:MAG: hypothetical protein MJY48_01235 [Bacteroidales bacterium]|nr:hypothetical protein [Bacteroidales bacterium]
MKHLLSILAILWPVLLFAQSPDYFKKSSKISNGILPNGVSYYLVQNDSDRSFADFALVQKGNDSRELSHGSLEELTHFQNVKPYAYLAEKGIGYTVSGLASYSHSGAVYRFQNVPQYSEAASDSILLMLFDLMGTYPGEQAVIISGDINVAKTLERMKLFSMLVTPREPVDISGVFEWEPSDSIEFECTRIRPGRTAYIDATFCTPRLSASDLASTQAWVAEMFADEIGSIVRRRLENEFKRSGIPHGGISFSYRGSENSIRQERYKIRVCVSKDNLSQATEILGKVTASLSRPGISREEFSLAKGSFASRACLPLPLGSSSNPAYVNKCISHYLFGAGLYEEESKHKFFVASRLEPSLERRLLASFASSVFDRNRNVILHYSSPDLLYNRDSLVSRFYKGWDRPAEINAAALGKTDSSGLEIAAGKLKIRSIQPDSSIGGEIWTFDNGIKVLYRKAPTSGVFSYAFMFRGGAGTIHNLKPGELPYIQDMLGMYEVAGMSAGSFKALMESKGLQFNPVITPTDLRFTGTAPVSSLPMLFKGMNALVSRRNYNSNNFNYYRRCQRLCSERDTRSDYGIAALFDSLSAPQYKYSQYRNLRSLGNDTPVKAQTFYDNSFASFSNGLIVLVGDLDDYALKQYLSGILGAFGTRSRTARGNMAWFTPAEHPLSQGTVSLSSGSGKLIAGDGTVSVNIFLANNEPFSVQRYAALSIGARAMSRRLVSELDRHGMYVSVKGDCELRPNEIMSLTLQCRKCKGAGLPSGVGPADSDFAIIPVRRVIAQMASEPIPENELKAYKASFAGQMKAIMSEGKTMVEAALARYSMGKNIYLGYESAINAVTSREIMDLMKNLSSGAYIEYTVK